jgi:hypothetical protein
MHPFLHQMNSTGTNMNVKYRISVYCTLTSLQVCQYPQLVHLVYNPSITMQNYIYFSTVRTLFDQFQTEGASYELITVNTDNSDYMCVFSPLAFCRF